MHSAVVAFDPSNSSWYPFLWLVTLSKALTLVRMTCHLDADVLGSRDGGRSEGDRDGGRRGSVKCFTISLSKEGERSISYYW